MPETSPFPIEARLLLPHAGPMCCIDRLLSASKAAAVAEVVLTPEHRLLCGEVLDPAGYVELAAQTCGAMSGYDQQKMGLPPRSGFLVGVQEMVIHGESTVGDRLRINVIIEAELGGVTVLSTRVCRADVVLAEGRLKVFEP